MASPMTAVQVVREAPKLGRKLRKPSHNFRVRHVPFVITPFMIAPVLPGETMTNLLVQTKAQTGPLVDTAGGWWYEQYYFYVKHRDLDARDLLTQMHLDAGANLSSLYSVDPNPFTGFAGNGIDWVDLCLRRVVTEYFRDEGEAFADATNGLDVNGDGYLAPLAKVNGESWHQSIVRDTDTPDDGEDLPGEGTVGNMPGVPDTVPTGFENHYAHWQTMRDLKLTDATFEDYLKSFGVRPPAQDKEELHTPELLRYFRSWEYPAVTSWPYSYEVPPAEVGGDPQIVHTAASAMAARWTMAERADKDRYFAEPGFIFGVGVMRPKTYRFNQAGVAVQMLDNAFAWLPAVLSTEAYTSLRKIDAGDYVLPSAEVDWWVDLKDQFIYGDQFINMNANAVSLPIVTASAMNRSYADPANDVSSYALADLQSAVGSAAEFWADGRVDLEIKSRLSDTSL